MKIARYFRSYTVFLYAFLTLVVCDARAQSAIQVPLNSDDIRVSSSYGAYVFFAGTNAVDGKSETYWLSAPTAQPHTLTLDLNGIYLLDQIQIDWFSTSLYSQDYQIEASIDGTTFVPILSGLDARANPKQSHALKLEAATHVRIKINRTTAGQFAVIREVRVVAIPAIAQLPRASMRARAAGGMTISGPEKAIDGKWKSYWRVAGNQGYLYLDLDAEYLLDSIDIDWFSAESYASLYDIKVSVDGATYTTIASSLNAAGDPNQSHSLDLVAARYVLIHIRQVQGPSHLSWLEKGPTVREVRVFGAPAPDAAPLDCGSVRDAKGQYTVPDEDGKFCVSCPTGTYTSDGVTCAPKPAPTPWGGCTTQMCLY